MEVMEVDGTGEMIGVGVVCEVVEMAASGEDKATTTSSMVYKRSMTSHGAWIRRSVAKDSLDGHLKRRLTFTESSNSS